MNLVRAAMLREMGLAPLWRLRSNPTLAAAEAVTEPADAIRADAGIGSDTDAHSAHLPPIADLRTSAPTARRSDIAPKPAPTAAPSADRSGALIDTGRHARIAGMDWAELEADMRACQACTLCTRRRQVVPGVGNRSARWMLVGEAPGAEEDRLGEPFVGPAGKLLDNMLAAVGLSRDADVFIANTVKCRPQHNRTPEAGEIAACLPYLQRQIELVQPDLLIALGRPAALALLKTEISISTARGRLHRYHEIPVVVSYHPAYLLRNPQDKGKAWEDLCLARKAVTPKKT